MLTPTARKSAQITAAPSCRPCGWGRFWSADSYAGAANSPGSGLPRVEAAERRHHKIQHRRADKREGEGAGDPRAVGELAQFVKHAAQFVRLARIAVQRGQDQIKADQ